MHLCSLLNLAIYSETSGQNLGHSEVLYGRPENEHQIIHKKLNVIVEDDSINMAKTWKIKYILFLCSHKYSKYSIGKRRLLGKHSLQKSSAIYTSCCGISGTFINKKGQWHLAKADIKRYIETTLPSPDTCTVVALCATVGSFKHILETTNEIDQSFLL